MNRACLTVAALAPLLLSGCTTLFVGVNDSRCGRDLAAVRDTAERAQRELARGVPAEQRQPTLARMVDAADHARATCGYEAPDTPGADRARQPKAG